MSYVVAVRADVVRMALAFEMVLKVVQRVGFENIEVAGVKEVEPGR